MATPWGSETRLILICLLWTAPCASIEIANCQTDCHLFTALLHASTRRKAQQRVKNKHVYLINRKDWHPLFEISSFGRARKKSPTLCIHVEQRFGTLFWYSWFPTRFFNAINRADAKGRGNEKGISLNECPEGLALRVTKKHQQALGAETTQTGHPLKYFCSKNFTRVESRKKSLV